MNILKARCKCGSRATIIRTKPLDNETAILTSRCDNPKCQRVFQSTMTYFKEICPPIQNTDQQLTFLDYTGAN